MLDISLTDIGICINPLLCIVLIVHVSLVSVTSVAIGMTSVLLAEVLVPGTTIRMVAGLKVVIRDRLGKLTCVDGRAVRLPLLAPRLFRLIEVSAALMAAPLGSMIRVPLLVPNTVVRAVANAVRVRRAMFAQSVGSIRDRLSPVPIVATWTGVVVVRVIAPGLNALAIVLLARLSESRYRWTVLWAS